MIQLNRQDILARHKTKPVSRVYSSSIVQVGKPLPGSEDTAAVENYKNRIDRYVQSLNQDARNQIVYQDYRDLQSTASDYGEGELASVSKLKHREAARGASQTAKDLAWSKVWNQFYIDWTKFQADPNYSSLADAWEQMQAFETRLRALSKSFASLGGTTLTDDVNKVETLESSTGKKEDIENVGIPTWVYWAIGGTILTVLVIVLAPSINALTVAGTK